MLNGGTFFRSRALAVLVLLAACLGLYVNTLPNALLWDDLPQIAENRAIRDIRHIPRLLTPRYWNESHPSPNLYRPVREISLALDYFFWKLDPAGYRVTNILIHAINVLLIFYLTTLVAAGGGAGKQPAVRKARVAGWPFLTALFFAAHPIHTESINLVKNRSELLALLFVLISLLLFIRHLAAAGRSRSWLMLAGAWLCFAPALLSKETALSLPGVAALYAVCFISGEERKKALVRVVPYGVTILAYFWFMHVFIRPGDPLPPGAILPEGAVQRALTVMKTLGMYGRMLLVPFPLNAEHAFTVPESLSDPGVVTFLCLLALSAGIAVRSLSGKGIVLFAIGWIGLTLVPAANIVYLVSRPIAEQRLYIPSLGFCLLLAVAVQSLSSIRPGRLNMTRAAVIGSVVFALYAAVTVQRNRDWRDEITFYSQTAAASPKSARIHNNLGVALKKAGRYEEAIGHFQDALRLNPDYINAHLNLAVVLYRTGRSEDAVRHYQAGLAREPDRPGPDYAAAYNNLGAVLMEQGDAEKAMALFRKALTINPEDRDVCYNLGVALMSRGNFQEASALFARVLKMDPGHGPARREQAYCRDMISGGLESGK
ncbi:MAG: tetratricopeptide repeat protein [Thermodesulfobacteriota bacterium]